jgi:hypothetical protein
MLYLRLVEFVKEELVIIIRLLVKIIRDGVGMEVVRQFIHINTENISLGNITERNNGKSNIRNMSKSCS